MRHQRRRRASAIAWRRVIAVLALAPVTLAAATVGVQEAGAATDTVTNCDGSGAGSLAAAVAGAASGDTITFSVSCPPRTPITIGGAIDLTRDITISGPGSGLLAVSGGNVTDIFNVSAGVTAEISGLTVDNGNNYNGGGIYNNGVLSVTDSAILGNIGGIGAGISNVGGTLTVSDTTFLNDSATDLGGGIFNDDGSTATVTDSTLDSDSAQAGGGIVNDGTTTATDSTLSGDAATSGDGGGILNNGTVLMTADTVADNSAAGAGGGIMNTGSAGVAGTIVADSSRGGDCAGGVTDAGYNLDDDGSCGFSGAAHSLSGVDADLGPLEDNRGPTNTQSPAPGSPVLDAIPPGATGNSTALCPGTDQRGVARPQGSGCDIGAVELATASQAITSPATATATVGTPLLFTVTTTGYPAPTLSEKGRMSRTIRFTDNGDGSATVAGTPRKRGTYHLTITATFGPGGTVVTQAFTLTVTRR